MRSRMISRSSFVALAALLIAGTTACGSGSDADDVIPSLPVEQRFPDVIDAEATLSDTGWAFAVTLSSPYDTPERYADGWRIIGPDGSEYGFRLLTHDHASEQPFTRTLDGVEIPEGVTTVTIEGRDQQYGFGGTTFELLLPTS